MNFSKDIVKAYALELLVICGEVGAPVLFSTLSGERADKVLARAQSAIMHGAAALLERMVGDDDAATISSAKFKLSLAQMLLQLGVARDEMEDKAKVLAMAIGAKIAGRLLG